MLETSVKVVNTSSVLKSALASLMDNFNAKFSQDSFLK